MKKIRKIRILDLWVAWPTFEILGPPRYLRNGWS